MRVGAPAEQGGEYVRVTERQAQRRFRPRDAGAKRWALPRRGSGRARAGHSRDHTAAALYEAFDPAEARRLAMPVRRLFA